MERGVLGCYGQVLPLAVDGFQLMDSAVVGVEEITAVRDALNISAFGGWKAYLKSLTLAAANGNRG